MTVTRCALIAAIVIAGLVSVWSRPRLHRRDWPQWRGPNRDGAVAAFTAPQQWPEQLVQRWKVEVGLGYATPLVVGNRVYMFSRAGDNETMSALDAGTGKELWQTGYPAPFTMHSAAVAHGPGPKSTPVLANGKLFAIGMTGVVTAFDAATGKQLWQKPGSPRGADVYEPRLLAAGRPRAGHLPRRRPQRGSADGVRREHRRREVEMGRRRPGVRVADRRRPGRHPPDRHDHAGKLVGVDAATGALLWERPFVSGNNTNADHAGPVRADAHRVG